MIDTSDLQCHLYIDGREVPQTAVTLDACIRPLDDDTAFWKIDYTRPDGHETWTIVHCVTLELGPGLILHIRATAIRPA